MKDNKLIAEFRGWVLGHPDPKEKRWSDCWFDCDLIRRTRGDLEPLLFHKSWDWLMPVVEKIESMGYSVKIIEDWCEIIGEDYDKVADFGGGKLISVYAAIVEFIKWYNKNRL